MKVEGNVSLTLSIPQVLWLLALVNENENLRPAFSQPCEVFMMGSPISPLISRKEATEVLRHHNPKGTWSDIHRQTREQLIREEIVTVVVRPK